jgi:ssDNA-binding Zn-finger/Zn-ribbon topoisomerase 1
MTRRATRQGLRCPQCGAGLLLKFTRPRQGFIYRRRECASCRQRFTTAERIVTRAPAEKSVPVPLLVARVHDLLSSLGITAPDLLFPDNIRVKEMTS